MKNKTVLITGGNIDIGLATARLLGADGISGDFSRCEMFTGVEFLTDDYLP